MNKFDQRERLTEALKTWRLQSSAGVNALIKNLNRAIKPHDVDLIAKHGALELMVDRIELANKRQRKMAFGLLKFQHGTVIIPHLFIYLSFLIHIIRVRV